MGGLDEVFELDNELDKEIVGAFNEDASFERPSLHTHEVESLQEHIETVLLGSCWWYLYQLLGWWLFADTSRESGGVDARMLV